MTGSVTGFENIKDHFNDFARSGAVGFGVGAAVAVFAGSSVLLSGGICAISCLADSAIEEGVDELVKSKGWNNSTVTGIKALSRLIIGVATIATLVALGIIGPLGAIFLGIITAYVSYNAVNYALNQRQAELKSTPPSPLTS